MREILLTSSVLILAVLLLRAVSRSRIPHRVQYALWGLVLLRLLIPGSLPALPHNVLSAAEPMMERRVTEPLARREIYLLPQETAQLYATDAWGEVWVDASGKVVEEDRLDAAEGLTVRSEDGATLTRYATKLSVTELLRLVWAAGMAVTAAWFLCVNLRFARKVRRTRTPFSVEGCRCPVYRCDAIPSPCLFGLLRPAIYVPGAAAEDPEHLRHVLTHEQTHARHLDPLWSALRCVCLAVYWFDPLVWAAAIVSKTDCELACDEGTLARLGEEERLSYGETLLSLIPVRRGPDSPALTATSMSAGKRRLAQRIRCIAENRKTAGTALALVLAAAAIVCVLTFTGAKKTAIPADGELLKYFNTEFFNGESFNFRNQFLSSLYDRPEDIDLFELFYCGIGTEETLSLEEERLVGAVNVCPTTKISADVIDAALQENTGLKLAETRGLGMEKFAYLADYDAYYHTHGDTNYRGTVTFSSAEAEGDLIRLYYEDGFFCDGWKCVTLRAVRDASGAVSAWHFVSNRLTGQPAVSTVFPEGEPWQVVSLEDAETIQPEHLAEEIRSASGVDQMMSLVVEGGTVCICRTADGSFFIARQTEKGLACFLPIPRQPEGTQPTLWAFRNVLGHDGVMANYYEDGIQYWDYCIASEDGGMSRLLHVGSIGEPQRIDLDGDGTMELTASAEQSAEMFFLRGGEICRADAAGLLQEVWTELEYYDYGDWDPNYRCLRVFGLTHVPEWSADSPSATACCEAYFDGQALRIYREAAVVHEDHVAVGISAPEEVLTAAKVQALERFRWWQQHSGSQSYIDGKWQDVDPVADWDDWCVTRCSKADTVSYETHSGPLTVEVYTYGFLLHTTTPEKVLLSGGAYLREDGWAAMDGGGAASCLIFRQREDGRRELLEHTIPWECGPDNERLFRPMLSELLMTHGLLLPSETETEDLCLAFYENSAELLNLLGRFDAVEQQNAVERLAEHAGEEEAVWALRNLQWNNSALNKAGRAVYQQILGAIET